MSRASDNAHGANVALALSLAHAGIAVFPVSSSNKVPLTPHGFKDAATKADRIADQFRPHPSALAAAATEAFWVLDIDNKPTLATSMAALLTTARLTQEALENACDLIVATPGGGRHLYFARTPGFALGSRAGDIAPGVDTRGHDHDGAPKSNIIAPGNRLPDGREYRPLKGSLETLLRGRLREAPTGMLYLGAFNERERAEIRDDADLRAAISTKEPQQWRVTYETISRQRRAAQRPAPMPASAHTNRRQARYGEKALAARLIELSAMRKGGRSSAAFKLAAYIGVWVHHGILDAEHVRAAIFAACKSNGLVRDNGWHDVEKTIRNGFAKAANDPLPDLGPPRSPSSSRRAA